jgi:hypothetical protein
MNGVDSRTSMVELMNRARGSRDQRNMPMVPLSPPSPHLADPC